jgi:hypothetical protein
MLSIQRFARNSQDDFLFGMSRQDLTRLVTQDLKTTRIANWIDSFCAEGMSIGARSSLDTVRTNLKKRVFDNRRQVYHFPGNLGTSHLFPEDWQNIFSFLDQTLANEAVVLDSMDEEISLQQLIRYHLRAQRNVDTQTNSRTPPISFPKSDVSEALWMDLVYNERVKDPRYFWRFERILNYLSINPRSAKNLRSPGMFPAKDEPGTNNPLIEMNVKKSERRKKLAEAGEGVTSIIIEEDDEEEEKNITFAKVLVLLLYFMNDTTRDRLVRVYLRSIREKFRPEFVSLLLFTIRVIHTRIGLFSNMAVDVLHHEMVRSMISYWRKEKHQ